MTVLVTGAAGFVGSHLCETLLADGEQVTGVDAFTDYYPRTRKEHHLAPLLASPRFSFLEADLNQGALEPLLEDVDVVYHVAGQPGVRPFRGRDFESDRSEVAVA